MRKRQIVIERHRYAPELNKFYFIDSDTGRHLSERISCAGLSTTREIREKFFSPLHRAGLTSKLVVKFPERLGWPDAVYSGFVSGKGYHAIPYLRSNIKEAARRHSLEGTTITTTLKLVG